MCCDARCVTALRAGKLPLRIHRAPLLPRAAGHAQIIIHYPM
jgi:hypothetical protein